MIVLDNWPKIQSVDPHPLTPVLQQKVICNLTQNSLLLNIYTATVYTGKLVLTLLGICLFPFLYNLYTWKNKRFLLSCLVNRPMAESFDHGQPSRFAQADHIVFFANALNPRLTEHRSCRGRLRVASSKALHPHLTHNQTTII